MKTLIVAFLSLFFFGLIISTSAQIINVPDRIQNKVINRVNRKIDKGIDKGLDAIEDSIKGNKKKSATPASQKTDTKAGGTAGTTTAAAGSKGDIKQDQPSLQSYSKYDFTPGEKVIFYEDFIQDAVGDAIGAGKLGRGVSLGWASTAGGVSVKLTV